LYKAYHTRNREIDCFIGGHTADISASLSFIGGDRPYIGARMQLISESGLSNHKKTDISVGISNPI
jgi:hypothetical protein